MKITRPKQIVWLYSGDHTKHPFITLTVKSLVEAGYSVTVLDSAQQRVEACYQHIVIPRRIAITRQFYLYPVSGKYGYSKYGFPIALFRILALRPEIIIATLPMPAAVGMVAAKLLGSRLVYYPFELFGEQVLPVPNIMKKLERQVLSRGVDAIITQNEERAKIYVQERQARVMPVVVHNYKPRQKVNSAGKLRSLFQLPSEYRIVLYEGILYDGRDLDKLVQSAAYLPENARLVLMGRRQRKWWPAVIEPLLNDPVIAKKVLIADWVPQTEIMEYAADADVGIIIYSNNTRNNRYCEPGKLSDYVFAGVPIAASRFPTIEPIIRRYGIGETFAHSEPQEIARAINKVLSIPKSAWQPALEKASEDLAWETQVNKFLKAVSGEH